VDGWVDGVGMREGGGGEGPGRGLRGGGGVGGGLGGLVACPPLHLGELQLLDLAGGSPLALKANQLNNLYYMYIAMILNVTN